MTDKEIALLDLVIREDNGVTLAEAINYTGFSKTTVYRNLENLAKMSLMYKNGGRYFPGAVMLRWMNAKRSNQSITRIFEPYLEDLLAEFNHTVHLVQLQDNNKGVYIQKLQHEGAVQIKSSIGDELILYSSGAGRAILAEFSDSEVEEYFNSIGSIIALTAKTVTSKTEMLKLIQGYRGKGYAVEIEQNEDGIQCVGVAFKYGDMMLAISMVTTTLEPMDVLDKIGASLVETKKRIENDLK